MVKDNGDSLIKHFELAFIFSFHSFHDLLSVVSNLYGFLSSA